MQEAATVTAGMSVPTLVPFASKVTPRAVEARPEHADPGAAAVLGEAAQHGLADDADDRDGAVEGERAVQDVGPGAETERLAGGERGGDGGGVVGHAVALGAERLHAHDVAHRVGEPARHHAAGGRHRLLREVDAGEAASPAMNPA